MKWVAACYSVASVLNVLAALMAAARGAGGSACIYFLAALGFAGASYFTAKHFKR